MCPLRSGISPAEAARRQEARKRQQTEAEFARLANNEQAYEEVKAYLEPHERQRIAELRERRLAGDTSAYYGHDLLGAVARGQSNRARSLIRQAMEFEAKRFPESERQAKMGVGMAMHAFIDCAAQLGLSADQIRYILTRELNYRDSSQIEKRVERHGPKQQ